LKDKEAGSGVNASVDFIDYTAFFFVDKEAITNGYLRSYKTMGRATDYDTGNETQILTLKI
jgi:hypothetical protein